MRILEAPVSIASFSLASLPPMTVTSSTPWRFISMSISRPIGPSPMISAGPAVGLSLLIPLTATASGSISAAISMLKPFGSGIIFSASVMKYSPYPPGCSNPTSPPSFSTFSATHGVPSMDLSTPAPHSSTNPDHS
ncbi:MAG TPA: hypothetical protein DET40_20280 [Lentisphaeria bacterium]|nr:hypothetical protein [Lentisphaeria bacterium]